MDIAGAKALKKRLGANGTGESPPASVEIPTDAPPVYHWTGKAPSEAAPPPEAEDNNAPRRASRFSRLSPTFGKAALPIQFEGPR
jgi:hypothetical protein